jgi:ATP-dependent Clp protease, protease subunit
MSGNKKEEKKNALEGLIFMNGSVSADNVCKEIIRYNIENEVPVIQLIINSQGGYCSEGFAIIDIIEWSRIPVYITGIGMIASMGLLIFMSGEKGHRVITPRTSILSHRYFGGAIGNHSSLIAARKEQDLMHQRIINHYFQHTKIKTEKELNDKLLRDVDTWLTPEECVSYGIADIVQQDTKNPLKQ